MTIDQKCNTIHSNQTTVYCEVIPIRAKIKTVYLNSKTRYYKHISIYEDLSIDYITTNPKPITEVM